MVFKEERIKDADSIGDTDTSYECDLPKALISALHLRIHGTGGATSVALAYTMITNVRIDTDGNDGKPLDLSSAQLARRAGILEGIPPAPTSADGAYSQIPLPIYFGTKAKDKRLMLDLRGCSKRKLKLTFDTDLIDAARFAAGAPKFTLIAMVWVGAVPPEYMGHIRQEQVLSQATGTGDLGPWYDLPLHKDGKLAFMDITVSAVTTVENVELTAKNDSIHLINEHIRDIINRMNVERHLDTALTLTAYYDWMFLDRYETQVDELPIVGLLGESTKLVIERGATTTTVVLCLGTIRP